MGAGWRPCSFILLELLKGRFVALERPRYRLLRLPADAPAERLALSPTIAEAVALSVASGESPPTVLFRHQQPYVLLGPDDRRLPRLADGLAFWRDRGLPVYERISGGSAVVLDGHCLSFAVARPCRDLTMLHRNYREMAGGIVRGLQLLGLPAEFGPAPGSFCEGPYDIVVDGVKIAGVAQAIRRGFALVSGMVLLDQDPAAVTDLLNAFYRFSGVDKNLRADAVTNVARLLGRPVSAAEVEAALKAGFQEQAELEEQPVGDDEWARARDLVPRRRVA